MSSDNLATDISNAESTNNKSNECIDDVEIENILKQYEELNSTYSDLLEKIKTKKKARKKG